MTAGQAALSYTGIRVRPGRRKDTLKAMRYEGKRKGEVLTMEVPYAKDPNSRYGVALKAERSISAQKKQLKEMQERIKKVSEQMKAILKSRKESK